MILLKKAKNEKSLIKEQNSIKKYLSCVAVYDMPQNYSKDNHGIPGGYTIQEKDKGHKGFSASVFVHDYGKPTEGYRLYIYVPLQDEKM